MPTEKIETIMEEDNGSLPHGKGSYKPVEETENPNCPTAQSHQCLLVEAPKVCTFEIYMTRCIVDYAGNIPIQLMITGYANGRSAVIPGNGLFLVHNKGWGWRTINKLITTIEVEKGTEGRATVNADVIVLRSGPGSGSWAIGSGESTVLTLNCGGPYSGSPVIKVDCRKLSPNFGIEVTAKIEFQAYQVSP